MISGFWCEKHWERAHIYSRPKNGTGTSDVFGRLWNSSEDFGLLREFSEMIGSSLKVPELPRLYLRKSWQVYSWIKNLLLGALVCSIAVYLYSWLMFVIRLTLWAHQNTAQLIKIYSTTHKHLLRYLYTVAILIQWDANGWARYSAIKPKWMNEVEI